MEEGEYEFYAETQNEDNQKHPPVFYDPTTPTVDTTRGTMSPCLTLKEVKSSHNQHHSHMTLKASS